MAMLCLPGVMEQLRAELLEGLFTLSPAEAAQAVGLGMESFETATLAPGGPRPVQLGKKKRFRLCELRRWLDGLQGTPGGAAAAGLRKAAFTRLTTATTRPVLPSASGYQFGKAARAESAGGK